MSEVSASYNALLANNNQNALNAKDMLNFYQIYWCDSNIKDEENQYYAKGFKHLGFINIQEFESKEELILKIDLRKTQKNIILITSGRLAKEVADMILDPTKKLRKGKILDMIVFCGDISRQQAFIKQNVLSLEPRKNKVCDEFEDLEKFVIASIKEITRMQADVEKSKPAAVNAALDALPIIAEGDVNLELAPTVADNQAGIDASNAYEPMMNMFTIAEEEKSSPIQAQADAPKDIIFGKQMDDKQCNINIFSALKQNGILRNGQPFWAFQMDIDMHLSGITFAECQILTQALCDGLVLGAKKYKEDIMAACSNTGTSWLAKKQVQEWKEQGHDQAKIDSLIDDIVKKANKTAKQLIKNCNEDVFKMHDDGAIIFNWQRLPVLAIKLYCQGTWLTWRCEEMMWSPFNPEIAKHLGLWQGLIQGLIYTGIVERKDENNLVSLSTWAIPEKLFEAIYKTMYISDEMLQTLKDIANGPGDEETKTIKIQGIFTCAINIEISVAGNAIKAGNKVLFKVRMITEYQKGDPWDDNREYLNQAGMLLGTGLQKDNVHIAVLYEPEMTVNQVQYNANDDMHTVELQVVPSDMKKMDW